MNIEELFDNEKFAGYGIVVTEEANCAIDYLKTEVMEYVAGLEKRIAEHEAEFDAATERFWEEIASSYRKGYLEGSASNKRIAELEKELAEEARLNGMGAEREAKLLARVAELEEALDVRDRKLSDIASACESAGCLNDEAMDDFIFKQKQRIAELEASAYNEGCDDGHVNGFAEGDMLYNEKEQELT